MTKLGPAFAALTLPSRGELVMLGLGLSYGGNQDRENAKTEKNGSLPVWACAKLKRATCWQPTKCGQAKLWLYRESSEFRLGLS